MKDEKQDETPEELGGRTKRFALSIIERFVALPKNEVAKVLGRQVLRSGTSVGAHYREASRARSDAEFISKLGVALQELEETVYWLDLLVEARQDQSAGIKILRAEADELLAIITTIVRKRKITR